MMIEKLLLMGTVGVIMKLYLVIAELIRDTGSTSTDLINGTLVICTVNPDVKMSIILPSRVIV